MFPWWNKGWNRNAISGPGGMENSIIGKGQTLLAVGWKGHLCSYQWRASHLLEQMLGYWWVSSETAAVHLQGSPLHDGLVHSVLHCQHLHYLLPVLLDETLHQAEWKALGSSPTWEKQVRSGYLFWSDDLRYGCNPLWTKDSISISLQMQPHQCCSWNWMQCWSMLMALSCCQSTCNTYSGPFWAPSCSSAGMVLSPWPSRCLTLVPTDGGKGAGEGCRVPSVIFQHRLPNRVNTLRDRFLSCMEIRSAWTHQGGETSAFPFPSGNA